MANYWAIAIGINQYQLFQPLRCAQADAEVLSKYLADEAGFAPQRCLLMTDTSPPIGDRSTYPTKENILLLLEDLTATCWQPQDHLWLFFSGYGVNYEGQDYLMPVEGNPELAPETGIEVRSLMQSLQIAELNVLLLLDINRASGTQADAPTGQETIELAEELQLASIVSCQPDQFSRESSELGHGFFTAALLEALRAGNGSSLEDLKNYLSILTPELCQHYWRPIQNPVTVIPTGDRDILPSVGIQSDRVEVPSTIEPNEVEPIIFPQETFAVALAAPSLEEKSPITSAKSQKLGMWGESVETNLSNFQQPKSSFTSGSEKFEQQFPSATEQYFNQPPQSVAPSQEVGGRFLPNVPQPHITRLPANKENTELWKQFLFWGGGTILVVALISIVILRNQVKLLQNRQLAPESSNNAPNVRSISQTPSIIPPQNQSSAQIAINSESKKQNQALLDLAKKSLKQTQASDLRLAIATARKIKPGEPLYEQAQENIKIWSQMILDLAEGRAKQRQYASAIAAAQAIAKDDPLYPQAQAAMNQWRLQAKQYLGNRTLLDAANRLIEPGQASTYNRAIEVAKRVPQGQPGFDMAQKSIKNWSEKILDIAKSRADQGNFTAAIETAALVPEVTAVYEDAQEAIQKWQARKIKN
ncbi:caspase family protein [Nostocaceae cyanobacterium CENA369]|uniref:Caspase family protein n=1 Tax=Dendronalium phyllosphericum CENA369 TaxID=1725256 RepID=A0A8J7IEQ0_9NOST|nr:caspase family protein [Dendronalium phyllosphericum]MBH8576462.1 caspase family protein [Dendronalium phyllosphericum CENA369]